MAQTTITIIRTSARGAHFITDGVKQTWIQGRWLREDGTLTPRGQQALEAGDPYQTPEEVEAAKQAAAEAREKAREAEREKVTLKVAAGVKLVGETEKAIKVWLEGSWTRHYGKMVRYFQYLPKSQVSFETTEEGLMATAPRWFWNCNSWLMERS